MADIAELGVRVDGREVVTAEKALDNFVVAAEKAESATKKLGDTSSTELGKSSRAAKEAADSHVSAYRAREAAGDRYLQTLRDEIATVGRSRAEIERYRAAQAGLSTEQQRTAAAMGAQLDVMRQQQGAMTGLQGAAAGLGSVMAITFGAERIFTFTKAMFDASAAGQRLRTTLDFSSGGNGAKELQYVTQFADKLGLQLQSTAQGYSGLAAAARGTSLEGEGARKVFESVAKASTVMGLSADDTSGVLRALTQVMSKGTLQAEEIRGQIGERLPGAFQIAARAMGVTTEQLGKMLEQGLVPASEFLPKFAAQLEKELGGAAESAANRLDASVNRFDTAWERLKRAGGDAGVAKGFAAAADAGANGFNALADSIERMSASRSFGEWLNAAIWSQKNLTEEIKLAQEEVDKTDARLAKAPNNIYFKTAAADAQEYLNKLREIESQQQGLTPGTTGPGRIDRERQSARDQGAIDAARRERTEQLESFLTRNATLSKTEQLEKDIAKAREASAKMAAKWDGDEAAQARIRKALEQEITNIREKHKPKGDGAAAAARDEINAELEEFRRGQQVQEEIARRNIANIGALRREGAITAEDAARRVAAIEAELNAAAITALELQISTVQKRKNSEKEVAALRGQIAVQNEKQLTREAQLEQTISDIRRERAEQNERRHSDEENKRQAELTGLEENNKRTREEIELIGLTDEAKQRVISARMDHTIALQRERMATVRSMDESDESLQLLDLEEKKLRELIEARDLYNEGANKSRAADIIERQRQALTEWRDDFVQDVGGALTDAIVDGGKNGAESVRKSLQDALIRKPLNAVINAGLNVLTNGVLGALGIGGGLSAAGGSAGGGGLGTLLQLGSMGYQAYTGQGMMGAAWGGLSGALGFGSSAVGGSAATLASTPWAGAAMGNYAMTSSAASTMGAFSSAGIAGAIMLAVINVLGGMRSDTQVGSGLMGTLGNGSTLQPWEEWREGGTLLDGPSFATHNPLSVLQDYRDRLAKLQGDGQGANQLATVYQTIIDKMEIETKGLEENTRKQSDAINKAYTEMRRGVVDMANSIGLAGNSVENFAFTLAQQDLNFQGLKPEEIQEKITTMLGKAGGDMAKQLLGYMEPVTETITRTIQENIGSTPGGEDAMYSFREETETVTRMVYRASEFAKAGESALETLTRLSTSFNALNEASNALGFGLHEGSLSLAAFASDFVEAFGGLEKFTASTGAFLQNYYSDEERRQAGARSAAAQAKNFGLNVTAEEVLGWSKADVRNAVNSLIDDPAMYGKGMDFANGIAWLYETVEQAEPAVRDLGNAVDELTQKYKNAITALRGEADTLAVQELRALGLEKEADALERLNYLNTFVDENGNKLDQTRLDEIARLYDINAATKARIKAIGEEKEATKKAMDTLRAAVVRRNELARAETDTAVAEVQRWIDIQRELAQETVDAARATFDVLKSNVQELYRLADSTSGALGMTGSDFIAQALETALLTGYLPEAEKLTDAIGDVRNSMDKTVYGSKFDRERARLVLAGQLSQLQEVAGDQLTEAEQQLAYLDGLEKTAEDQLAELRGIGGRVGSLDEAIRNAIAAYQRESATKAATAGYLVGSGSAIYDTGRGVGQTADGTAFSGSAMTAAAQAAIAAGATAEQIWNAISGSGFTMEQANSIFGLAPGTLQSEASKAGLPIFHNGTGYVQNTGFALLERGESVTAKGSNPLFAGGSVAANASRYDYAEQLAVQNDILREIRDNTYKTKEATNGRGDAPMRTRQKQGVN